MNTAALPKPSWRDHPLIEAGSSALEIAHWFCLLEWWSPRSLVGSVVKRVYCFFMKPVFWFVAIPGTLPVTGAVYTWLASNGMV